MGVLRFSRVSVSVGVGYFLHRRVFPVFETASDSHFVVFVSLPSPILFSFARFRVSTLFVSSTRFEHCPSV
jgi:hypothetical protein